VKIAVNLTIELDDAGRVAWAEKFGTGNVESEVRESVREQVARLVAEASLFTDEIPGKVAGR